MSKSAVAVGIVIAAVGGAMVFLQHADNAEIRQEIGLLRNEVQQLARTRPAAPRVEGQVVAAFDSADAGGKAEERTELSKLRNEITTLSKSTQELTRFAQAAQAAAALKNADSAVPVKLVPVSEMKNAGKGTPAAAMETVLWAAVGGDVDTLANGVVFTASAREKADAMFARLSDATQAQYGSPEKLIALMIAKDAAALSGMQVLGQKEVTPDDMGMRVRVASDDGKTKEDTFVMHRSADGWRLLLPDVAVDKFARQLGGGK